MVMILGAPGHANPPQGDAVFGITVTACHGMRVIPMRIFVI